jgi:hypothetical protein
MIHGPAPVAGAGKYTWTRLERGCNNRTVHCASAGSALGEPIRDPITGAVDAFLEARTMPRLVT